MDLATPELLSVSVPDSPVGQPPHGKRPVPTRAELRTWLREAVAHSDCKPRILDALVAGITTSEAIAAHLKISTETVKRHFTQLFERTGIHDRVFVAVLWCEVRGEDRNGGSQTGEG